MTTRLELVKEDNETFGRIQPVEVTPTGNYHGLSVGSWYETDGHIYLDLYEPPDTIAHEIATSKAVRAEIAADKRAKEGVEVVRPFRVEYNPKTKRFKQVFLDEE